MSDHGTAPSGRLTAGLGPERLAFVLSVLVVIILALALRFGPFATATRPSPNGPTTPAPSPIATAPASISGFAIDLPRAPQTARSVPGRPARAQA